MNFVEFLKKHQNIDLKLADRYGDWLGYEIEEVNLENKSVVSSLKIRDEHLSPSGAVHGGVISGFLDFSCGCAAFSTLKEGELCSTVELNVKYFKPLRTGDEIIAKAKVVHRGKTLCSVMAETFKRGDESKAVSLATGTFNIYPISKIKKS